MNRKKSTSEIILDFIAGMSILAFFMSLILKVWTPDEIQWVFNRICVTSLLLFVLAFVVYGWWFRRDDDSIKEN